jgi:hypothetical protein
MQSIGAGKQIFDHLEQRKQVSEKVVKQMLVLGNEKVKANGQIADCSQNVFVEKLVPVLGRSRAYRFQLVEVQIERPGLEECQANDIQEWIERVIVHVQVVLADDLNGFEA